MTTVLPPLVRPRMPNDEEENRSIYLRARRRLIDEDFDEMMVDWITQTAGSDTANDWGPPDTSMNPIANHTKQLVTPGLYGRTPTINTPAGGDILFGEGGYLEKAGIFRRNMGLQYLTVGMGVFLRKINVVDIGYGTQVVDRLVDPSNVCVWVDESDPMREVAIWELRVRRRRDAVGNVVEHFYVWDRYDISDPNAPRFSSIRVDPAGNDVEDVTRLVSEETAQGGYDWLDPESKPFLPFITYRAMDTGVYWPMYRRGMHKGTLRACAHWTYTSRAALFATGEHILLSGVESLPGTSVRHGENDREMGRAPTQSMHVTPGMISLMKGTQGETIQAVHVGPGVNLPNLSAFSNQYNMLLAIGDGLHPTDATRQSANPTSGAALEISAQSRREYSIQVQPFFRTSDLETIRKSAWMLTRAGVEVPADGYSITYHTIPLSPTEQEDLRADLEWQEANGQVSPVDVHLRLYPGKTNAQARDAVIAARVERAKIAAEVAAALAEDGIVPAPIEGQEDPTVAVPPADPTADVDPTDPDAPAVDADPTAIPKAPIKGQPVKGAEPLAATALNGAQVTSAYGCVTGVAKGEIPRESGIAMLIYFFQQTPEAAEAIMATVGKGFVPKEPEPAPMPGVPNTPPKAKTPIEDPAIDPEPRK